MPPAAPSARKRIALTLVTGFVSLWALAAATPGRSDSRTAPADPWRALELLRGELARTGPLGAEFTQSYVPAGFESGDSESGRVAIGLPDCLRWDYAQPYAKSFLVCGARAWNWVEGEPRGRRATIDAADERGLDLLLLPADELARRYRLTISSTTEGGSELAFEPLDTESELAAANLVVDASGGRPLALEWRDREGSVTSFRFRSWHALESTGIFSPPEALDWTDPVEP